MTKFATSPSIEKNPNDYAPLAAMSGSRRGRRFPPPSKSITAATLADISWPPTITTQKIGEFDFSPFPNVEAWYNSISARPQFEIAFPKWIRESAWGHG